MAFSMTRRGWVAAALITALLAGCGTRQPVTSAPLAHPQEAQANDPFDSLADPADSFQLQQDDPQALATPAPTTTGKRDPLAFLDQLNLTADQKTQIDAIKAQHASDLTKADMQAWISQFKTIMQAETVDKTALQALLKTIFDKLQAHTTSMVDALGQVRDVLTEDQRKQAAVLLLKPRAKRGQGHAWGQGGMRPADDKSSLTREQRKAFRWMRQFSRGRMRAALASFMLTGDKTALTEALTIQDLDQKISQMTDVLAGLTLDQRNKLIAKMEKHHGQPSAAPSAAPVESTVPASPAPSEAPSEAPSPAAPAPAPTASTAP